MTHALTLSPARLWRDVPRETLVLGGIALAASAALAGAAISDSRGLVGQTDTAELSPAPPRSSPLATLARP